MKKIGITGGIGSGKTTISKVFELLGVPVFYADTAARQVMVDDEILKNDLIRTFGNDTYANGSLNRKYLANIVFSNQEKLGKLNSLVHPAVFRAFDKWSAIQTSPYILKEAALLFESGSYKMCDESILIKAPLDLKLKRVIQRDQVSEQEVLARMNRQMDDSEKESKANHVINNDELNLIIPQVLQFHQYFLKLANAV